MIRTVKAGGDGLFADFHFNPKHALAEQLLWDAERAPENVGFSHNVEARTTRRGDRVVVEAITRVQSVDLVADPATTRGLFEAATVAEAAPAGDGNPSPPTPLRAPTEGWSGARGVAGPALTLVDLQRDYPQLVEALVAEQTAEVRRLEAEVARLTLAESLHQKREAARQLLREFHLPEADSADPVEAAVTSKRFVESLLAAADAEAMRRLVEERARLVQSLGGGGEASRAAAGGAPRSRDQHLADGVEACDARSVCGSNHRNLNRETRRRHTPCVALDFGTRRVPTTFHPFLERAKP